MRRRSDRTWFFATKAAIVIGLSHAILDLGFGNWGIGNWELGIGNWEIKKLELFIFQYGSLKKIIARRAPDLTDKCHSLCDCNARELAMTKNVK